MRRLLSTLLIGVVLCVPAYGFEPFEVKDIRIDGLQRISPGTVFNALPVQVGDVFTEHESERTIRSLFKSGYFKDIVLERQGNVLIVRRGILHNCVIFLSQL